MLSTVARWLGLGGVALAVTTADQFSKAWVAHQIDVGTQIAPIPALAPLFTLTHVHNTGGAFSILPQAPALFSLLSIVMIALLLGLYARLEGFGPALTLTVGLQLGGGVGNLIDRLQQGYVVDFLYVHGFPVFNLADVALVSGTLALFLLIWWTERRLTVSDSEVIC